MKKTVIVALIMLFSATGCNSVQWGIIGGAAALSYIGHRNSQEPKIKEVSPLSTLGASTE
ncbi:hypothetical protein LCGC14_0737270 [marine sediment metagenome]|uniref:Lipoprotein n=1 Tax=marine sediment metagenome TaxID=412755 RepID=A0A0F9QBY6_9ZZZZ